MEINTLLNFLNLLLPLIDIITLKCPIAQMSINSFNYTNYIIQMTTIEDEQIIDEYSVYSNNIFNKKKKKGNTLVNMSPPKLFISIRFNFSILIG